jgi:hypothetical protein
MIIPNGASNQTSPEVYQRARIAHWNQVAKARENWIGFSRYYHARLEEIYQHLVSPGQKIIEIGCASGDLLNSLEPDVGIGVDFSFEAVKRAVQRYPGCSFICADAHNLPISDTFDVIILSDLLNDLWDIQTALDHISNMCHSKTRIIINSYSHLWEVPLALAERLRLATPSLYQNWLTVDDIVGLLALADFEVIRRWEEILLPLDIPLISGLLNRVLVRFWPFTLGALTNFVVAKRAYTCQSNSEQPSVSVIIPARNEAGNIDEVFRGIPETGRGTELIFAEGHSTDNTYEVIQQSILAHGSRRSKLLRQTGSGKGDAVRIGFSAACGEILMILDADLTVPPEALSRFYQVLRSGKFDFLQ